MLGHLQGERLRRSGLPGARVPMRQNVVSHISEQGGRIVGQQGQRVPLRAYRPLEPRHHRHVCRGPLSLLSSPAPTIPYRTTTQSLPSLVPPPLMSSKCKRTIKWGKK